jgi:hypothetical protein
MDELIAVGTQNSNEMGMLGDVGIYSEGCDDSIQSTIHGTFNVCTRSTSQSKI